MTQIPLLITIAILNILGTGSAYAVRTSEQFNYDNRDKIDRSLEYFRDLPQSIADQNSQIDFLLEKEAPKQWLLDRVHYLIPTEPGKSLGFSLSKENYVYPNIDLTTDITHNETINRKKDEQKNAKTLMTNTGANLYEKGKRAQKLLSVNLGTHFSDLGVVPITSPRIGLISIAPYFFSEDLNISETGNREADLISVLAFLFHEARHSDGSAQELGFPHSKCPSSSDYAGLEVCDQAYNGPYAISSLILNELRKDCADCTEVESEVLRLMYIDFQQRILNDNAMTLEKKEKINDLQNQLDLFYQQLYYEKKSETVDKLQVKLLENLIYNNQEKLKVLKNTKLLNHTYWSTTPEAISIP